MLLKLCVRVKHTSLEPRLFTGLKINHAARQTHSTPIFAQQADRLKSLMRNVGQPVTVVTANLWDETSKENYVHGATLSSCTVISLRPPLLSFSLSQNPSRLAHYLASALEANKLESDANHCGTFEIHFLSRKQAHIAKEFAGKSNNFKDANEMLQNLAELRKLALGSLSCSIQQEIPLGSTAQSLQAPVSRLYIADILDLIINPALASTHKVDRQWYPLLYYKRGYVTLDEAL